MTTSVSVVIPARNEADYIAACVQSVLQSNYPQERLDVWVVDGQSEDGTTAIVEQLAQQDARVHLVNNPARVTPVALNLGINSSKGDVVIILGGHATVEPDFVANNVKVLEDKPEVGCAGGTINNIYQNKTSERIGVAMSSPFGVGNAHFRTGGKSGYVDTVAFGAYRRSVLDEVGLFDERLVRNQDDELNYRITKAGYKIWLSADIRSNYYVRSSLKKLARQYYQYGYWKVFVNKKHRTVTTLRQLAPPIFVFCILAWLFLMVSGPIWGPLFPWDGWGLVLIILVAFPLFYFSTAIGFAAKTLREQKKTGSPALVMIFFILHVSYGWGYLEGLVQFFVMNKQPGRAQTKTSR